MDDSRCRFPPTARWAKINVPIAGTVVGISGRPFSTSQSNGSGMLILTVEDIVYNPGTVHILADPKDETGGASRRLHVKRKNRTAVESSGM